MKTKAVIFEDIPQEGELTEVTDQIFGLRLPLPFALNHVNVWALRDTDAQGRDAWCLIDFGIKSSKTIPIWEGLFQNELKGPVSKLIATHFHPDHIGLAGWVQQVKSENPKHLLPFYTTQTEWLFARMLSLDSDEAFVHRVSAYYHQVGLSAEQIAELTKKGNGFARIVSPIPTPYLRLQDSDIIPIGGHDWQVIIGEGHGPEHISLYSATKKCLIVGDQILPKITPNISIWPHETTANNLKAYLTTLQKFKHIPDDVLVLPSHNLPFYGVKNRVLEIEEHHRNRLAQTLRICNDGPKTGVEILERLFNKRLDANQMFFAIGETVAHLNYLVDEGKLSQSLRPDDIMSYEQPK